MAIWDRQDLHTRLQRALARPATDAELVNIGALGDELLSDAQMEVAERLAAIAPETNYGAAIALTSADGGKTYSTASAAIEWIGQIQVFRDSTLKGYPLSSGAVWDNSKDYAIEGPRTIRITGGRTRVMLPFARIFQRPTVIDGTTPPVLKPQSLLRAVVQLAAANFCDRGGKRDPSPFLRRYENIYATAIGAIKPNQSSGMGGSPGWWNLTGDLGRMG